MACAIGFNSYAFNPKNKPVHVIIPFGPGGGTDTVFRKLQKYGEQQGINLIPIYRPGANGMIGMQSVYDSSPDGMIFGVITFDTVTTFSSKSTVDLSSIVTIQKNTFGVVTNKNESLREIVSNITDKKPMKIGYLLFSQKAIMQTVLQAYGVKSEQVFVPYKAGSEMIQNVINGDIDVAITSLNVLAPLVKVDKLKLIATDSNVVQHDFDDVPSLNILDPIIGSINKGSSIVLPPNTNESAKKFWQKFVQGYIADPQTKNDAKINYWEPVHRTTKELEKDLIENIKILK